MFVTTLDWLDCSVSQRIGQSKRLVHMLW